MRLFKRCPFCHQLVLRPWYERHRRQHVEKLPDGQMRDHITVAPSARYSGSLAGVPRSYRHPACRVVTTVSEDIIRSYLANPFLYGERFFCCGCGDYIGTRELFWTTSGESLFQYMRRLQAEYLRAHGAPPPRTRV